MRSALLALCLLLSACESCEEQGGTLEFSHLQPVTVPAGKSFIISMIPIYVCKLPEKP